jgi:hypothetical protein
MISYFFSLEKTKMDDFYTKYSYNQVNISESKWKIVDFLTKNYKDNQQIADNIINEVVNSNTGHKEIVDFIIDLLSDFSHNISLKQTKKNI